MGECIQELEVYSGWILFIAFSHDSSLIVSALDNDTVRLWRSDTGECVQKLKGHSHWRIRKLNTGVYISPII
ncbi:hypothetical protein V8C34DRAFT_299402 [Trichoderma compactum]